MKKRSLLLAILLLLGLFAGCTTETAGEGTQEPSQFISTRPTIDTTPNENDIWRAENTGVPGYNMSLPLDTAWVLDEESSYDLEMSKDGVTVAVIAFTPDNFEEMPTVEELYERCNNIILKDLQEVTTLEEKASYELEETKISSQLFSAKDGDVTKQYYCFMVEFADDAGSLAWVSFTAEESVMTQKKAELKTIVETMESDEMAMAEEDEE